LNIVLYNIFAGSSKGPDIYGTEPWHFYIRNLALNFNIWLPLALAAHPLLFLRQMLTSKPVSMQPFLRSITFTSVLYLWLTIFTLQPHKEERFMYPAYPMIALNAAYSLHILLQLFGNTSPTSSFAKVPGWLKLIAVVGLLVSATLLSILRTAGLVTGYSAPLKVYGPLQEIAQPGDTVCLGKEWYRFTSSYFLPDGVKAKFIKSSFTGLLPGEFPEWKENEWGYEGTKVVPSGMNDENKEDLGKYVCQLASRLKQRLC
jgi:alpha-1,2-mannosyltransferase